VTERLHLTGLLPGELENFVREMGEPRYRAVRSSNNFTIAGCCRSMK
jgi:hypothetical protein